MGRWQQVTVREGTLDDLPSLSGLIERARQKMGPPYLLAGPETTKAMLRHEMQRPGTVLLVAGEPPCGFLWAEALPSGEMLVHEVCMIPGHSLRMLEEALHAAARRRKCTHLTCLTYRPGGPRFFKRFGFKWTASLLQREVK